MSFLNMSGVFTTAIKDALQDMKLGAKLKKRPFEHLLNNTGVNLADLLLNLQDQRLPHREFIEKVCEETIQKLTGHGYKAAQPWLEDMMESDMSRLSMTT